MDVQVPTNRDLAPAVACSDVQLAVPLRHVRQGSLCGAVGLSGESNDCLIDCHLITHQQNVSTAALIAFIYTL